MSADRAIPILLYHRIGDPPRGARVAGQYVSAALFRRHLSYLRRRGYETVSLIAIAERRCSLPARPVAITFDDGYRCLHEEALPALSEHGFSATVFLVAGAAGGTNTWEQAVGDVAEPLLGLSEMREMKEAGVEFGSHTLTHPHLTALPADVTAREIADSKARIEDLLGAPCRSFAYPYGDWNSAVRDLVAEAGYEVACTTQRAAARRTDDPLALPRINIRRYNIVPRFAYKLWRAGLARP
jgi:peptidoglycan/xylan/chitin deacetylase (PgdA/CDA1 family)